MNKVKKKNLFSYSDTDGAISSRSSSASGVRGGKGGLGDSFKSGVSKGKSNNDKSFGDRSRKSGLNAAGGIGSAGGRMSGKGSSIGSRTGSPDNRWRDSAWNDRRMRKKKKKLTKQ